MIMDSWNNGDWFSPPEIIVGILTFGVYFLAKIVIMELILNR